MTKLLMMSAPALWLVLSTFSFCSVPHTGLGFINALFLHPFFGKEDNNASGVFFSRKTLL